MVDREQMAIDLLCGELQTSWSYCDPSCISCKFYYEDSDMGARVSICVHGFGSSKESCGYYMTQHEYMEFVRSCFANLKADNAELQENLESARKNMADELEKQVSDYRARHIEQARVIADLDEENAKLREFIDLKETCWKYVGWCDECPYNGVDDEHDNCNCTVQEKIDSLARELGIEVPK